MGRGDFEGGERRRPEEPAKEGEQAWRRPPDPLGRELGQQLDGRADRIVEELHRALHRQTERTTEIVRAEVKRVHDEFARGFGERLKTIESTLGSSIARIREVDDSVRASRIEMQNVRSGLDGIASSVAEEIRGRLSSRIEALDERLSSVGSLQEGLEQITAFAETMEELTTRSGIRKLRRVHDQLSDEEADLVGRLEAAGHRFEETVGALEERIDGIRSRTDRALADLRADNERSAEQVQREVTEAVTSLYTDITGALERLKEQMELLAGPRSDIQAVRTEIAEVEGRLATAIQQLDGRVAREAGDQKARVSELTRGTAARFQRLTEVFEVATEEVREIESHLQRLEGADGEPGHPPPPNDVP